jgi:hypothetical protein
MMKKLFSPYFKEFLIFYIVYNGLLVGSVFIFDKPESNTFPIILYRLFFALMLHGGMYIISIIYGMHFQYGNNLKTPEILLFTGLLFFIGIITFSPWLTMFPYTNNPYELLFPIVVQSLSFLIGNIIAKVIT